RSLENVTSIVIGQRISSVMDANRIIILDEGKIVSIGNHDELLKTSSIYKELYDAQIGGKE
ncbi:TPA: ABC transporter ATP-binding protein, partial [Candidatus Avacholeplasma faecigallinarum]|nr:ABC transporter ATP-binding protein [Candidatus Avacholeplasma faecigallinarum]